MTGRRKLSAVVFAAASALALAGCSQIAAIAPVGGDRLAEVRYVANDKLVDAGINVLTAPVCSQAEDDAVTCAGETLDGESIRVASPSGPSEPQDTIAVMVGAATIYSGSIQSALEKGSEG